jgi:hypothetical protein
MMMIRIINTLRHWWGILRNRFHRCYYCSIRIEDDAYNVIFEDDEGNDLCMVKVCEICDQAFGQMEAEEYLPILAEGLRRIEEWKKRIYKGASE